MAGFDDSQACLVTLLQQQLAAANAHQFDKSRPDRLAAGFEQSKNLTGIAVGGQLVQVKIFAIGFGTGCMDADTVFCTGVVEQAVVVAHAINPTAVNQLLRQELCGVESRLSVHAAGYVGCSCPAAVRYGQLASGLQLFGCANLWVE